MKDFQRKYLPFVIKSIFAGVFIAIGCKIYVSSPNIFGATLFSIALISIMLFGFKLFTGSIGFLSKVNEVPIVIAMLILNFAGCCLLFTYPQMQSTIMANKLANEWYVSLINAILCGILIHTCVLAKKSNLWWVTIIAIPTFILAGFEHCVADFCYMILTRTFTLTSFGFLGLVIVGNAIGSILLNTAIKYKD